MPRASGLKKKILAIKKAFLQVKFSSLGKRLLINLVSLVSMIYFLLLLGTEIALFDLS